MCVCVYIFIYIHIFVYVSCVYIYRSLSLYIYIYVYRDMCDDSWTPASSSELPRLELARSDRARRKCVHIHQ